jgi:23S rRNA pseudouridine2605 synthase
VVSEAERDRTASDQGPEAGTADAEQPPVLLRLNKALAQAGFGSRRSVEAIVLAGRVELNGEIVLDLGRRVDPDRDRLAVDGSRVVLDTRRRYWLLNKPTGVVTTASDERGRPTVVELVPDSPRVYPVGRLDLETEGLLLLTNDGDLAHRLMHPSYGVQRRYLAEVDQLPRGALARLTRGVELDDGPARAERARIVGRSGHRQMIEIVMVEGRNREVRRLLDAVGAPVRRLVRTALGPLRLTGLSPGQHRQLTQEELRKVYKAVGL